MLAVDADSTGPVLLFGARGWVGSALREALRGASVVVPTRQEVDACDLGQVVEFVATVRPRAIVNLAACNPGQGDAERMENINHHGARYVAAAAQAVGARLVLVSSDMVLDGEHAPYTENAPPVPINAYGESKARGERATLELAEDCVAVRTSLVWDPAVMDRSTADFARQLTELPELVLFEDEIRMPIARRCLAAALHELLDHPYRGVLNVAGRQPLSRHGFGSRLLSWFDVPGRERVRPGTSASLGLNRPRDLTLDLTLAGEILSTPLLGVDEELAAARSQETR